MTNPPISTLKFRVTRAKTSLDDAQAKLRQAQDLVEQRQRDLTEAMEALDDASYGGVRK